MSNEKAHYWDMVSGIWQHKRPQKLWRAHSDAVNTLLLSHWLPTARAERLLKTDLFDEAWSKGLYPLLSSSAKIVIGMDVSALSPHVAKARYNGLRAICADVRRLPFLDGSFDVLVSNSTLDHFESHEEILTSLRELHRVLRPGGQLLLTLDNLANPLIALRNLLPFQLLNRLGIVPYYIGTSFGPRRLKSVLQQMNFEVIEVGGLMHFPRVLGVAMARVLERCATAETQKRLLRFLLTFEHLSKFPTTCFTGQFVAAKAVKCS